MGPLMLLDLLQLMVVEDHASLRTAFVPVVARGMIMPPAGNPRVFVLFLLQNIRRKRMRTFFKRTWHDNASCWKPLCFCPIVTKDKEKRVQTFLKRTWHDNAS